MLGCRDDECCPHALLEPYTREALYTDTVERSWGVFGFQPSLIISRFRRVEVNQNILQYTLQLVPDSGAKGLLLKHLCDYHFDSQMLSSFTLTSCWQPTPPLMRSASLLPSATSRLAGKDQHGPAAASSPVGSLTFILPVNPPIHRSSVQGSGSSQRANQAFAWCFCANSNSSQVGSLEQHGITWDLVRNGILRPHPRLSETDTP